MLCRHVVPALAIGLLTLAGCDRGHAGGSADGHDRHKSGGSSGADHHDHDHGEGAHADEVTLSGESIERYGVKVEEARFVVLRPTLHCPARVGFNTEAMAHVGSPLRGRVVEIKVRPGDEVRRGAELLVVESPELGQAQGEYLQKRSAAQSAGPRVELLRAAWDRARRLLEESEAVSVTEVQRREAEHHAAAADLRGAEAAEAAAENTLRLMGMDRAEIERLGATGEVVPRHPIRAPIDGRVVEREVTMGELVGPEREALLVLADTTTLWVLADVPEARLHEVGAGARAWIEIGPGGAHRMEGSVSFISPMVDAATRTVRVRIEVPSGDVERPMLIPGMFAQVEVVKPDPAGREPMPVIAVPAEAVQTVEGGPAVFVPVEGEPNTFAKRAVTTGPGVGGLIPILTGLDEGEAYVSSGSFILKAQLGKGSAAHEH